MTVCDRGSETQDGKVDGKEKRMLWGRRGRDSGGGGRGCRKYEKMRQLNRVDTGQDNRSPDSLEGNTVTLNNSTLGHVSLNVTLWRVW